VLRPSHFDEVAPVLVAVAQVDGSGGRSEGPIRRGHRSSGSCDALAGAGGYVDDDAGLAAELGRRRAVDDFERLDGLGGKLVGENLALLIGDGLAVDGERVGGVVAEAVDRKIAENGKRGYPWWVFGSLVLPERRALRGQSRGWYGLQFTICAHWKFSTSMRTLPGSSSWA